MTRDQAQKLAAFAHYGQTTKDGMGYMVHLVAVSWDVPQAFIPIALLHDVVEDTKITLQILHDITDLTAWELRAIELLTRSAHDSYEVYVERILYALKTDVPNTGATAAAIVKSADLRDHLDRHTPEYAHLRPRYERAYEQIQEGLDAYLRNWEPKESQNP